MPPLNKQYVASLFLHLSSGDSTSFFANFLDNVSFTVTGDSHPICQSYTSKSEYLEKAWKRIGAMMREPMKLSVAGILVESDGPGMKGKAVVELKGVDGVLKSGKPYNNEYCWIVAFNEDGKVESVRAYLDSAKLRDALEENE